MLYLLYTAAIWCGGFLFWPAYRRFGRSNRPRLRLLKAVFVLQAILQAVAIGGVIYSYRMHDAEWHFSLLNLYVVGGIGIVASVAIVLITSILQRLAPPVERVAGSTSTAR